MGMSREEAIKALKWFKKYNEEDYCGGDRIQDEKGNWYYLITDEDFEAFDVAIKALEQEPRKGHWIETAEEYYKAINEKGGGVNESTDYFTDDIACSECLAKFSVIENEADRFDFCPCCGSDNR